MANALHTPGVVNAKAARLDDGGLVALQGPGALDARTGVLHGPGTTTLVTGTSSTSPMRYSIAPHHWVTSRGAAFGPYRGTLEATQLVDTTPAPGSGSRIDVIWVKQQDNTVGIPTPDGTAAEQYGCTQGTSTTGTPTKPTIPVGAEELATATVAAGATATNGAGVTITNTARQTVARGAPIPVRNQAERDALTGYPGLTARRLDLPGLPIETHDGSAWDDGTWAAFTPSFSATGFALGNGVQEGRFRQSGKTVQFIARLTIGSTTNLGTGNYVLSLPANHRNSGWFPMATGAILDASTGVRYQLLGEIAGSAVTLRTTTAASPQLPAVTGASPLALAAGDILGLSGVYEAV